VNSARYDHESSRSTTGESTRIMSGRGVKRMDPVDTRTREESCCGRQVNQRTMIESRMYAPTMVNWSARATSPSSALNVCIPSQIASPIPMASSVITSLPTIPNAVGPPCSSEGRSGSGLERVGRNVTIGLGGTITTSWGSSRRASSRPCNVITGDSGARGVVRRYDPSERMLAIGVKHWLHQAIDGEREEPQTLHVAISSPFHRPRRMRTTVSTSARSRSGCSEKEQNVPPCPHAAQEAVGR